MSVKFNNKFAEWVRSVIDSHGKLSLRQVEIRTGVSYSSVQNMLSGRTPGAETIIRFASGFRVDVPMALRIAGYEDIAELWQSGERDEARLNGAANVPGLEEDAERCPDATCQADHIEIDLTKISTEEMGVVFRQLLAKMDAMDTKLTAIETALGVDKDPPSQ